MLYWLPRAISIILYDCCILNGGIAHIGLLHLHIVLLSLFPYPYTVWYYLWNTHFSLGSQSVSNKASMAAFRLNDYFLWFTLLYYLVNKYWSYWKCMRWWDSRGAPCSALQLLESTIWLTIIHFNLHDIIRNDWIIRLFAKVENVIVVLLFVC